MDNDYQEYQDLLNDIKVAMKLAMKRTKKPVFIKGGAWADPNDKKNVEDYFEFLEKIRERFDEKST